MSRLVEGSLSSFVAAAGREWGVVGERVGVVQRVARFGDRRVRLRFAGEQLARVLLPALAQRLQPDRGAVHATICCWEQSSCPQGAVRFPWQLADIGPGGLVRGSERDRVLAIHETGSGALTLLDASERTLLHRVPDHSTVPWWERAAPLRPALFLALNGPGRHLVHAGAVGDHRGGVLLAGASGSGKTTTALAALGHGLHYLADDYILLNTTTQPTAHAIYNVASVRPAPDADSKAVLNVDSVCASLPVRAVVLPRIRGGRSRLDRATPTQALLALAPSTVFQMPFDDGAALASLATLVRQVRCFTLEVGDDSTQLANTIQTALQ